MCSLHFCMPGSSLLSPPFISYSTTKKAKSHPCISKCISGRWRSGDTKSGRKITHWCERGWWRGAARLSRLRMLCVRWYPIVSAHFSAIWIKLPFIYIIKTFTYIKYQPFLSTNACLERDDKKPATKLLTRNFSRFSNEDGVRRSLLLHGTKKKLFDTERLFIKTCFSINFCHHPTKYIFYAMKNVRSACWYEFS